MIVEPYRRPPAPPQVAVLTESGAILAEGGEWLDPDDVPSGVRVFGQWDVVRMLMYGGVGEALCWNNEEVRWRLTCRPDEPEWKARPSDVYVLRLPLTEQLPPAIFLGGVIRWRDWLARHGASPTGTTGSSSMSLLRAQLGRRVACGMGERPPLLQTRGGRMQLGPAGQGRYEGRIVQLDMPAAYAALIGEAEYGGVWQEVDHTGRNFEAWLGEQAPMFVRADVAVPVLQYGPLMRCFRRRVHYSEVQVLGRTTYPDGSSYLYPVGRRLSGIWTRAEILAAADAGCKLKVRQAWVQRADGQPFAAWWDSILDARASLDGAAEALAKMTGNALWGRFCLDPRVAGRRTIRGGGAQRSRALKERPAPPPAHDLAEHVSGTVRGRLYDMMRWAGDRLLVANTDGIWLRDDGSPAPDGWRVKVHAHRLDVLAPACLRYWPERSRWPRVVFAGVPAIEAEAAFEREWALAA